MVYRNAAHKWLIKPAREIKKIIARIPLRRIAKDHEVAAAVAFLAMDKAAYITQNLSVDGGATINIL
ncbi:SDR family oxidoreductase [Mucilaginibacter sabulilitoris]|uniref:SDR family oxidoreductase n=1 Tax=Mucilaginibacter sabulilitoris TaxID=1173583 RepID=A0ABZ0TQQ1_9SPHI|nr:SDR family oxidoreductase [Mucilaginibacter sabulilitoris]WPU94762.1 SDR family oxidoreductase [Mucilaginibacter sabulilitoris]